MKHFCLLLVLGLFTLATPGTVSAEDLPKEKITISFADQEVREVISTLAKFGEANVIVSPLLKGRVSHNFHSVPWDVALRIVVKSVGGKIVKERDGILLIAPAQGEGGKDAKALRVQSAERVRLKAGKHLANSNAALESMLKVLSKEAQSGAARAEALDTQLKDLRKQAALLEAERDRMQVNGYKASSPPVAQLEQQRRLVAQQMKDVAAELQARREHADKLAVQIERLKAQQLTLKALKLYPGSATPLPPQGVIVDKDGRLIARGRIDAIKRLKAASLLKAEGAAKVRHLETARRTKTQAAARALALAAEKRTTYASAKHAYGAASTELKRKRIKNLKHASRYLTAAGDAEGAKRALAQAAQAERALDLYEVRMKTGAADGQMGASLDGLRREVHALRDEVRELTALVRHLLQQQK